MLQTKICHLCRKEKDLREFKVKINGEMCKNCIECYDTAKIYAKRSKCPHEKRKSQCRECDGSSFCSHGKRKSQCRDCDGTSICQHGRRKIRVNSVTMRLKLPLGIGFNVVVKAIKSATASIPIILSIPISYTGSSRITNFVFTTTEKFNFN